MVGAISRWVPVQRRRLHRDTIEGFNSAAKRRQPPCPLSSTLEHSSNAQGFASLGQVLLRRLFWRPGITHFDEPGPITEPHHPHPEAVLAEAVRVASSLSSFAHSFACAPLREDLPAFERPSATTGRWGCAPSSSFQFPVRGAGAYGMSPDREASPSGSLTRMHFHLPIHSIAVLRTRSRCIAVWFICPKVSQE
ncbi:hypothetical protein SNOG_02427 [Parastagonospora nodorum SN15]|uniref:Uncharacterized protein n=1 Tax=Phaeosphaeria nodorum (strain SN15 / ATCC MYA-4574 / FGSC 10173) TaxID=321614 RepID=Q0V0N7_PHANO|nr:hypothetical protein SNOG_02427 [Parastagonospora nodorum SN15]EAT90639.1 hypothetical protein SNOG_02427 [Parastagonospora nodorum SN15]